MDIETLKRNPKLIALVEALRYWNKTVNCISPRDMDRVWERHIADSAQIADLMPDSAKVADIGSGAGLPGLVLAAVRPDIHVVSVESDKRKSVVQRAVIRAAGLPNAEVIDDRVENIPDLSADVIVSRAFGTIAAILSAASNHMAPDACAILHKTAPASERELAEAGRTWSFARDIIHSKISENGLIIILKDIKPL